MRDQASPMRQVADEIPAQRARRRGRRNVRSSEMTTLIDGLAHDVRTPLTVIQEYAALMRDGLMGALNDEQQRVLDVIADRACDLNRAVDNAADASKLAAGTHRIWGRRWRLRDILARIGPQLMRKAAVRRVELQFEATRDVPDIHCDEDAVARALTNIVSAVLNLSCEDDRISVTADQDPARNEAGVRVRVAGAGQEKMIAQLRASVAGKRVNGASRHCELSLAAEVIDCNLGRLDLTAADSSQVSLWIGFPVDDPVEVLHRHLNRAMLHRPCPRRVSLFQAVVFQPLDKDLSRDVGSVFNSVIGRDDLAVELDSTCWLLTIVHKQARIETLRRRIDRRRDAVNRRRLGKPLPQVALRSIGSWNLPNDLARILSTVGRRIEQSAPVGVCVG
jgi:His Kinase A (phospho-acceptor) domain